MSPWFTVLSLLAFVVLTLGTALFVAAEFSLTALERSTVDSNAKSGERRDLFVQRAHKTLSFQLSGAQLGISITTLATGYLAEPVVARLIEPGLHAVGIPVGAASGIALALALLIATSVSMIFGELVPKNLAVARPVPTARAVAGLQLMFSTLMKPAIIATNGTANWILRRIGIDPAEELRSARSPQELVLLVRTSARQGSLDAVTATLVNRSLQFGELTAEELMTPRSKIVVLQADDTVADLVAAACESGFSRFPIVEGDLDETIGIVHVKQVFEIAATDRKHTLLSSVVQPVAVVPSTLDGDAVMTQIRANGLQTALVVDEYGATPDVMIAGNGWQVSGLLRIDEVAAATGYRAAEGEYDTIGGLILQELGHIPEAGESVDLTAFDPDGAIDDPVHWLATVVAMDGRRIDLLELNYIGRRSEQSEERDE